MNARGFGRSSIDYPRAAYYMVKVMLALFVGLLRRRPGGLRGLPAAVHRRVRRRRGAAEPSVEGGGSR